MKLPRWRTVRRVWVVTGGVLFVVFVGWSLVAFQAWGVDDRLLDSDPDVNVTVTDQAIVFMPKRVAPDRPGLIFFPGGIVDPTAYVPLVNRVARAGYPAAIVKVPLRFVPGLDQDAETSRRAARVMASLPGIEGWVIAGHSKGARFACRYAQRKDPRVRAMVLAGSTHPRTTDLSTLLIPVTKVVGTRDGIAPPDRVRASASNLPASTRWVWIEGANHSQFGHYGFQPGDRFAEISREVQQDRVLRVILDALESTRQAREAHQTRLLGVAASTRVGWGLWSECADPVIPNAARRNRTSSV